MEVLGDTESRSALKPGLGVYAYAEDPAAALLSMAWQPPGAEARVWSPFLAETPRELVELLADPNVIFRFHNAEWDVEIIRILGARHGLPVPADERLRCTMMQARAAGLPGGLDAALEAMGAPQDVAKLKEGGALIKRFCNPQAKNTKVRKEGRLFIEPGEDPERFHRFLDYNRQDLAGVGWLRDRLPPLTAHEFRVWLAHLAVNRRGMRLDLPLVRGIAGIWDALSARWDEECKALTGGIAPTEVAKLTEWARGQGVALENLDKAAIRDARAAGVSPAVERVFWLRTQTSRGTSIQNKTHRSLECVSADGRIRGRFKFADTQTGRWASGSPSEAKTGAPNFHNYPRPIGAFEDPAMVDAATEAAATGDADFFATVFSEPADALASILRGIVIPSDGNMLLDLDFTGIEAVMLAFLAGQMDRYQALASGKNYYFERAAGIYGVRPTEIKKGTAAYIVGKSIELAGGFAQSYRGFQEAVFKQTGLWVEPRVAKKAVNDFRSANREIVRFWGELEEAAASAVRSGNPQPVADGRARYLLDGDWLWLELPSGRRVPYFKPQVHQVDRYGMRQLELTAMTLVKGQLRRRVMHKTIHSENITSATCRDLLARSLVLAEEAGLDPVLHVHDQLACDAPADRFSELREIMSATPDWLPGFIVGVEGGALRRFAK